MGGCLWNFFLFFFVVPFVWNNLLRPLFTKKEDFGTRESAKKRYLRLLMPLLAKIAKADGRVSESEISRVEHIFDQLSLDAEEREYAKKIFNTSKQTASYFETEAAVFARAGYDFEARRLTFIFMVSVAASDGDLSSREYQMLLHAGVVFGLPRDVMVQILQQFGCAEAGNQRQSGWDRGYGRTHSQRTSSIDQRARDLALLGLSANASDEAIKKAYRQKVKELHPDRLQAQGLPEAMLKQATERMAEINAAYDRLTK